MNLWPWRVKTNTNKLTVRRRSGRAIELFHKEPHERHEIAVVALPLTLQELAELHQFLVAAGESERAGSADKQVIDSIRDRIVRFAERQGAWWDTPWSSSPVGTDVVWSGGG